MSVCFRPRLLALVGPTVLASAWLACAGGEEQQLLADGAAPATSDTSASADSGRERDAHDATADSSVCTPGALYCLSPREAAVCDEAGAGAARVTPCAGATACEPTSGLCRPTICEPDAVQCLNLAEFQRCRPDGSGWLDARACPEDRFCAAGRCRVCQAERVECVTETTFRQCAPDSSGWSDTLDCPGDWRCVDAACRPCDMIEECVDATSARRYCANDAVDFSQITRCEPGQRCTQGSCLSCEPGQSQCLGETSYRECEPDGSLWGQATPCDAGEVCLGGGCVNYWCEPRVLLLVDQSGSMGGSWDDVRDSITSLVAANPTVRFGLMAFPTAGWSCDVVSNLAVPFAHANGTALRHWFDTHSPTGATPLAEAIRVLLADAQALFGDLGGAVVVLSDGEDTCYTGGDIKVDLAVNTSALYLDHQVASYAVGYSFSGDPVELDTIANNGGTGLQTHIAADDGAELIEAFQVIVDDLKVCDP